MTLSPSGRSFATGVIVTLALVLGIAYLREGALQEAIAASDRRSDSLAAALVELRAASAAALELQAEADVVAERESHRAQPIANRMGEISDRITTRSTPTPTPTAGDTVSYVLIERPGDTASYRVPTFVMDDRAAMLRDLWQLKLSWEAERAARIRATLVTIPTLRLEAPTVDALVASQRRSIELRDARRDPWCGRRCGMVIGAVSTVLSAAAIDRVRKVTSPK